MRVLLTGGNGMLGAAIRRLNAAEDRLEIISPRRGEVDLTDQVAVDRFLASNRFDLAIHAAAKVGGIRANMSHPVAFLADNLALNLAVIGGAAKAGVPALLNIGSSCMYPKDYRQPLVEGDLLAAPLEPTNEGYALAKIVAARHCDYLSREQGLAYRTIIPCNLYGPGDKYTLVESHLVASVIAKTHAAINTPQPAISIWGDGRARREFLYVDDLAKWILRTANAVESLPQYLNVGAGQDHSVLEYYQAAAAVLGFAGEFSFDLHAPVGMHRKLLDSSRAAEYGWQPETSLEEGLRRAYEAYLADLNRKALS